jgi:hypothetical protein
MYHQSEIGLNLKAQIYLGNEAFVIEMQEKLGKKKLN